MVHRSWGTNPKMCLARLWTWRTGGMLEDVFRPSVISRRKDITMPPLSQGGINIAQSPTVLLGLDRALGGGLDRELFGSLGEGASSWRGDSLANSDRPGNVTFTGFSTVIGYRCRSRGSLCGVLHGVRPFCACAR